MTRRYSDQYMVFKWLSYHEGHVAISNADVDLLSCVFYAGNADCQEHNDE